MSLGKWVAGYELSMRFDAPCTMNKNALSFAICKVTGAGVLKSANAKSYVNRTISKGAK